MIFRLILILKVPLFLDHGLIHLHRVKFRNVFEFTETIIEAAVSPLLKQTIRQALGLTPLSADSSSAASASQGLPGGVAAGAWDHPSLALRWRGW